MDKNIQKHFDTMAPQRKKWEEKNSYYYDELSKFLKEFIPEGKNVLEIGCGRASLLKSLRPKLGVGIDISHKMLLEAKNNFQEGIFINADACDMPLRFKFDFIIISDTLGYFRDIQRALEELRELCTSQTRIIITYFNFIYEPAFAIAEKLGLKMPQPVQSWISYGDVDSFLDLCGFEAVDRGRFFLCPKNIPLIAPLANRFLSKLPVLKHLCITQFWIGKTGRGVSSQPKDCSVSIIVPAKNERGNIEPIVQRIPKFATDTEIIFVEGGSIDGTPDEIERIKSQYPDKDIKSLTQKGEGKADAVFTGMDSARGDIFMILDADMTVPPEELPKFYKAISGSNADLVMGSRLVYPMERGAMRFLNLVGNKIFAVILSWLISRRVKDTLCGTKVLFKGKYWEIKNRNSDIASLDPFGDFFFILATARCAGKIVEVPVRYMERKYGTTQISRFKHGLYLLRMCLTAARRIKFR